MNPSSTLPDALARPIAALGGIDHVVVLGSGLKLLEDLEDAVHVTYGEIEGWSDATVAGHAGVLTIGRIPGSGTRMLVARGRHHVYEGHGVAEATRIARLAAGLKARGLVLTNAAGGLVGTWSPGDLMLISDHINLTGLAACAPGEVPRHRQVYDPGLRVRLLAAALRSGIVVREGVYVGLLGPSYETEAEIRFLQAIGGHAVGMSTVLEAVAAAVRGVPVLGLSCITNIAVRPEDLAGTSHQDVVDVAGAASERLDVLLRLALED
ncbi:MAG: purine-nucleoside phosphorylase [Candidatus Sericytochromatia bacterium]|nr:purine-nucleoside phosphorylase [Candidatus Sericytochromatia bacterium]